MIENVYSARRTVTKSTINIPNIVQDDTRTHTPPPAIAFIADTMMDRVNVRIAQTSKAGGRLSKRAWPWKPR